MDDQHKEHYSPTSSSFTLKEGKYLVQNHLAHNIDINSDFNYRLLYAENLKTQKSNSTKNCSVKSFNDAQEDDCYECNESVEPLCHIKLESIIKLKNSTKKLLHLLDEIQSKTHTKVAKHDEFLTLERFVKPILPINVNLADDSASIAALSKLENQANNIEAIYVSDDDDDCSVYKKLTRKCHCLNQDNYNDFVIHFNEETKFSTSNTGELIKNMRIVKKFLYMGGTYTKKALLFLNEGMSDCQHTEKVEITQGCSHADICNIFDDHSIVITCISWPCKNEYYGDSITQALAAGLLYKLVQVEEGRRYLNFSSKISNDIRKVLRKKSSVLEIDTMETLNTTLNLLKPPFIKISNTTYLCKTIYEGKQTRSHTIVKSTDKSSGFGYKTINDLIKFRQFMTLDELLTHLDLLKNFSNNDNGKTELTLHLPAVLVLFKNMLMEFDNSEMNIIITNILNNIISKNMVKAKEQEQSKIMSMADTATEPIKMKHVVIQMPPKKKIICKKINKQKQNLGISPNKNQQASKLQVSGWAPSVLLNKSRKFGKDLRRSIIIVPIEKKY